MIHSAEISVRLQRQLSQDSGTQSLSFQCAGLSSEIDFLSERQIESHMKYNRTDKKASVLAFFPPSPSLVPITASLPVPLSC